MAIGLGPTEPAIIRGIKTVGIGKKGSRPLAAELAREILMDLKSGKADPVATAAFFAALVIKGISPEELILQEAFEAGVFHDPQRLGHELTKDAPEFVKWICAQILSGHTLDKETARHLGEFLFSNQPGDSARGLVASALRVRYETDDEYEGLLEAMHETLEPPFRQAVAAGEPIVQLAEPFDGVSRSYLITPLIADYIQRHGYRVVSLVGRSSGPKIGNNLWDITQAINGQLAKGNQDLGKSKPDFGWYLHQKDLSPAVDHWVEIRRRIVKRPFLATLERFLNPTQARISISSAFHPPYTEKMMTVCERAGYPGCIVMRNGQEGTLSFPLNRSVKVLCSARQKDGSYRRQEFEFSPSQILGTEMTVDEKLQQPSVTENARLILKYKGEGRSGNTFFDERVKVTTLALDEAMSWLKRHIQE